jgi:hypothetical protein
MKSFISKDFEIVKQKVQIIHKEILSTIHNIAKIDNRFLKSVKKTINKKVNNLSNDISLFEQYDECSFSTIFLYESLGLSNNLDKYKLNIRYLKYIDVEILLKDKSFTIFLKNILITDYIYNFNKQSGNFNTEIEYIKNLRIFFGDIRTIVLSYFLLNEENITNTKIKNITAYILKDSKVFNNCILSEKQQIILNQLMTNIKYEKVKESINNTNHRIYTKSNKFSILDRVKNSIKIKYITPKNKIRKITKEHLRTGFLRTYKDGHQVWISETIVNKDVA